MTQLRICGLVLFLLLCAITKDAPAQGSGRQYVPITWYYTDASVNPPYESLILNQGFDLTGYARYHYGSSAYAYVAAWNAYGWKIRYYRSGWHTAGIDMLDVAHWGGANRYGSSGMKNWGVYVLNPSDPYSWKAAYIIRY